MRWVDAARLALAVGVGFAAVPAHAAEPDYGKVETFQPGKKYTCVPTADHKGWDCRESGSGVDTKPAAPASSRAAEPPAKAAAPAEPSPAVAAPAPAIAAPAAAAPAAPAPVAAAAPHPAAPLPSAAPSPRTAAPAAAAKAPAGTAAPAEGSSLPAYLRAPGTRRASPSQPAVDPAAAAAAAPVSPPAAAPTPPAVTPAPTTTAPRATTEDASAASTVAADHGPAGAPRAVEQRAAAPAAHESPAAAPVHEPARPAPPSAPASAAPIGESARDFLALPGTSYVIEVGHASDKAQLDALRAALHPARGTLYDVRLRRDGNDWWLLLWGTFDSVDAARAARAELPADAPVNAGWPRLVAPLQNETRRAGE